MTTTGEIDAIGPGLLAVDVEVTILGTDPKDGGEQAPLLRHRGIGVGVQSASGWHIRLARMYPMPLRALWRPGRWNQPRLRTYPVQLRLASVPPSEERTMISRIWHGWTTAANADTYERLLREEIFVGIEGRAIAGFRSIQLLRREVGNEVEFVTIMEFESLDAVRTFAGDDYEVAVVPPKARAVLSRFDARSQHYEIRIGAD